MSKKQKKTKRDKQPVPPLVPADVFRQLAENAPVGLTFTTLSGETLFANDRWRELTGVQLPTPISFEQLMELLADDPDRDALFALYANAIATLEPFSTEMTMNYVNSTQRVSVQATPFCVDGQLTGFVGSTTDIAPLEQAIAAKLEAENRYRALFHSAPVGQVLTTFSGEVLEINAVGAQILGYEASDIIGSNFADYFPPEDLELLAEQLASLINGERSNLVVIHNLFHRSGERVWVSNRMTVERDADGQPIRFYAVYSDITSRQKAQTKTFHEVELLNSVTSALQEGVIMIESGLLVWANSSACELFGIPRDQLEGSLEAFASIPKVDVDGRPIDIVQRLEQSSLTQHESNLEIVFGLPGPDHSIRWVEGRTNPIFDSSGTKITSAVLSFTEITERLAAENRTSKLAEIIEDASDISFIFSPSLQGLNYVNSAAGLLFGIDEQSIATADTSLIYGTDFYERFHGEIFETLKRDGRWMGELSMVAANGEERVISQSMIMARSSQGHDDEVRVIGHDVTEHRNTVFDLAHRATHDVLTDLPNRSLLADRIQIAVAHSERTGRLAAVLFVDLDRFKFINDTYGHQVGDNVIVHVANVLTESVRPSDTVARLGGDEFVILFDDVDGIDHATAMASRALTALQSQPFDLGNALLPLNASIGVALSSAVLSTPDGLMTAADDALYKAKAAGKGQIARFDTNDLVVAAEQHELAEQFASAFDSGEIVVRFQPGVELETGHVVCVEALPLWNHPTRGVVAGDEFARFAESTGLNDAIGLRVLATACEHGRRWQDKFGINAPVVHVSLLRQQLGNTNLPVLVRGILDGSGLEAQQLCLELSESTFMEDRTSALGTMQRLKDLGVKLAINAFGTGYAPLSQLHQFPIDGLKIDGSFVNDLGSESENAVMVAAVVSLAASLELNTSVGGIDSSAQADRVRALGCQIAQGSYFGEPEASDVTVRLIEAALAE